jgi:hypothetical protein
MKEHSELFIGLDVSKLKTSVALAEDGLESAGSALRPL